MPVQIRSLVSVLLVTLLVAAPSFAIQSPLSDEAVREAYFLGQRHDGTYARMLDQYSKHLPAPKSGPYISSVMFLTPFAQLVHFSDVFVGIARLLLCQVPPDNRLSGYI